LVIVVNSHVISAHQQSSHPAKLLQLARGGGEEDDLIWALAKTDRSNCCISMSLFWHPLVILG
jgi:hypothetical protein